MIVPLEALDDLRQRLQDKKIVYTAGCFDLLHVAHIEWLERCKTHGEILVVGIVPDKRVSIRKGLNRPFQPQDERARIVHTLKPVDYVTILPLVEGGDSSSVESLLNALEPNVFVTSKVTDSERKLFENVSTELLVIPPIDDLHSSTNLISKVVRN